MSGTAATRERVVILAALGLLCLAAWGWTAWSAWAMAHMDRVDFWMPPPAGIAWPASAWGLTFVMWAVMMVAMMTPAVLPTVLLYAATRRGRPRAALQVAAFTGGYLGVWTAWSVAATAMQWLLHQLAILDPMMANTSRAFAAVSLLLAGAWQWSPLKERCLAHCRSPLAFLLARWREGVAGALGMGLRHGAYCVGCCWVLMALLFALGTMEMRWIVALTVLVLLEKLAPAGQWIARASGAGFIAWGGWLVLFR